MLINFTAFGQKMKFKKGILYIDNKAYAQHKVISKDGMQMTHYQLTSMDGSFGLDFKIKYYPSPLDKEVRYKIFEVANEEEGISLSLRDHESSLKGYIKRLLIEYPILWEGGKLAAQGWRKFMEERGTVAKDEIETLVETEKEMLPHLNYLEERNPRGPTKITPDGTIQHSYLTIGKFIRIRNIRGEKIKQYDIYNNKNAKIAALDMNAPFALGKPLKTFVDQQEHQFREWKDWQPQSEIELLTRFISFLIANNYI